MPTRPSRPRVLLLSNMYPSPQHAGWGAFVRTQVQSLRELGVEVGTVTRSHPSHLAYLPFYIRGVCASWGAKYDLVHAHYGFHSALPAMLLRAHPLVVTFHRGDALDEPRRNDLYRHLQRWCVRSATAIVAVSDEIRQALIMNLGASASKIRVIPCGIDPHTFRPGPAERARLGLEKASRLVLWSGSDTSAERKGMPIVLAVAGRLPETTFVLLGVSRPRSAPPNTVFPGRVPNDALPLWLRSADLFFLPSHSEGTPVSLLEAMACGTPVLVTRVGGIQGLVLDGDTGFHLPSLEATAATDRVFEILALSVDRLHPLAAAARDLVISRFSLSAIAKQLQQLYCDVAH